MKSISVTQLRKACSPQPSDDTIRKLLQSYSTKEGFSFKDDTLFWEAGGLRSEVFCELKEAAQKPQPKVSSPKKTTAATKKHTTAEPVSVSHTGFGSIEEIVRTTLDSAMLYPHQKEDISKIDVPALVTVLRRMPAKVIEDLHYLLTLESSLGLLRGMTTLLIDRQRREKPDA